jgi:hypothetical protein
LLLQLNGKLFFKLTVQFGCPGEDFLFLAGQAADTVFINLFENAVDFRGKLLLVIDFFLP